MTIPKKFTLGTTPYTVTLKPSLSKGAWGRAWLDMGYIEIATHIKGKPRPSSGVHGTTNTFWHEVTHAILFDMGNPLYCDEAFVNAFSNKLTQVIETAEL